MKKKVRFKTILNLLFYCPGMDKSNRKKSIQNRYFKIFLGEKEKR